MCPSIEEIVNCPELALKLLPEEARRTEARLEAALAAVRVRIRSLPVLADASRSSNFRRAGSEHARARAQLDL